MLDKLKVALILLVVLLIWIGPLLVMWLVAHLVFTYIFQVPARISFYPSLILAFVVTTFLNDVLDFMSEREFVKAFFRKQREDD